MSQVLQPSSTERDQLAVEFWRATGRDDLGWTDMRAEEQAASIRIWRNRKEREYSEALERTKTDPQPARGVRRGERVTAKTLDELIEVCRAPNFQLTGSALALFGLMVKREFNSALAAQQREYAGDIARRSVQSHKEIDEAARYVNNRIDQALVRAHAGPATYTQTLEIHIREIDAQLNARIRALEDRIGELETKR